MQIGAKETTKTAARYNRIASIYDLMEAFPERRFAPMRQKLWSQIPGGQVLEVGVGTGKNFAYHPPGIKVTGIDLSDRMLEQARRRLAKGADQDEVLQFVTSSLLKKILHQPSVRLREAGEQSDQAFIDAIRELFGLEHKD